MVDIKCTLLDAIGENKTEEGAIKCHVTGMEVFDRKVKEGLFARVASEDREVGDEGPAMLTDSWRVSE